MVKPDTLFKRTTNWLLDLIVASYEPEQALPGEKSLATASDVSRTTIRTALDFTEKRGIVDRRDRLRIVRRLPNKTDYFEGAQLVNRSEQIQSAFMEWIFRGKLTPGHSFSEIALARESGASTASVREYLIGFSRFGLIEKKARGGWRLCAFNADFARELADMRDLLELTAMANLRHVEEPNTFWVDCGRVERAHRDVKIAIHENGHAFHLLDREFHTLFLSRLNNRFIDIFYDIVSFIYHYQYQWVKNNEFDDIVVAIEEHLSVFDALNRRDFDQARQKMKRHLDTARHNLLSSVDLSTEKML